MDFNITEEQQLIVDTTRAFVENEMKPHEDEIERTGELDPEVVKQVKAKVSCSLPRILPKERELEEVDKFQKKSSRRLFEAIPTAVFIAEEALGKPKDQQTSGAPSFLQSS